MNMDFNLIIFVTFSNVELSHCSGTNTCKMNRECVPYVCNGTVQVILLGPRVCICFFVEYPNGCLLLVLFLTF